MRTRIGLFRGINVGGHNRVPMKDLVTLLCGLGLQEVRTYIQSGNVVFRGSGTAAALREDIGAAVSRRFGFRPFLVLLNAKQLALAAAANPFPGAQARPQSLHIGRSKFAARAPSFLGVAGTARNWRTVTQLLAMARSAQ